MSKASEFLAKCKKVSECDMNEAVKQSAAVTQKDSTNYNHGGIATLGVPGGASSPAIPGAV